MTTQPLQTLKTCIVCGESFAGFGHNAEPVASGRCCDHCNATKVLPKRACCLIADRYKSEIEGCLPDLFDAGDLDESAPDYNQRVYDAIQDFAADYIFDREPYYRGTEIIRLAASELASHYSGVSA